MGLPAMFAGDRAAMMTSRDLAAWEELYSFDPWGPERFDLAIGVLCAMNSAKPQLPQRYMPYLARLMAPPEPMSDEEIRQVFEAFAL